MFAPLQGEREAPVRRQPRQTVMPPFLAPSFGVPMGRDADTSRGVRRSTMAAAVLAVDDAWRRPQPPSRPPIAATALLTHSRF